MVAIIGSKSNEKMQVKHVSFVSDIECQNLKLPCLHGQGGNNVMAEYQVALLNLSSEFEFIFYRPCTGQYVMMKIEEHVS